MNKEILELAEDLSLIFSDDATLDSIKEILQTYGLAKGKIDAMGITRDTNILAKRLATLILEKNEYRNQKEGGND